jgi:hypothetical protein
MFFRLEAISSGDIGIACHCVVQVGKERLAMTHKSADVGIACHCVVQVGKERLAMTHKIYFVKTRRRCPKMVAFSP